MKQAPGHCSHQIDPLHKNSIMKSTKICNTINILNINLTKSIVCHKYEEDEVDNGTFCSSEILQCLLRQYVKSPRAKHQKIL